MYIVFPRATTKIIIQNVLLKIQWRNENRILKKIFQLTQGKESRTSNR